MLLVLVLTHQCDLACAYCYAGRKFESALPLATGQRAIERALRSLAPGEDLRLGLFGGEPLLAWERGRALLDYAHEAARARGVAVRPTLTTNGTHLDPKTLDELEARGVELAVSMDGLPRVHDRFRPFRGGQPSSSAALAAIDLLVARGLPFRVISVVRPETVDEVVAGTRFLHARGVRAVVHSLDYHAAWKPQHARALQATARDLRRLWVEAYPALELSALEGKLAQLLRPELPKPACGLGVGEVAVAPSGRLYPCERLVGADEPGPYAAGHVDDGDGPFRLGACASEPGPESDCASCQTQPACRNACACANLARSGAVDGPDGLICTWEQAWLEEAAQAARDLARPPRRLPLVEAT